MLPLSFSIAEENPDSEISSAFYGFLPISQLDMLRCQHNDEKSEAPLKWKFNFSLLISFAFSGLTSKYCDHSSGITNFMDSNYTDTLKCVHGVEHN